MLIDYQDGRPIYEQIVTQYQMLILRGILEKDEQLPSVRSLAMELSANPNTVQRAYQELERDGYIYSVKGKGSFVSAVEQLRKARIERIRKGILDLLREVEELGISPGTFLQQLMTEGKEKQDD